MSTENPSERRRELLDDFYAECDELLTALREGLSAWHSAGDNALPDRAVLDELFRHAHTLKGNSAIAGLRLSEELAHGMEDVFRAISKNQLEATTAIAETLEAGTQRLEHIIGAHRHHRALPEIQDLLATYRGLLGVPSPAKPSSASTPTPPAPMPPPNAATEANALATFVPARELDARGVNVGSIRKRLGELGPILQASPRILGPGSITFEFRLKVAVFPSDPGAWADDGVTWERIVPDRGEMADEAATSDPLSLTPSHLIRVDLARLDELMRITGELVIHRSRLEELFTQISAPPAGLREASIALHRSLREMRGAITRARLVPISELFTRIPYVVRDLMRDSAKKVRVVIEGGQTEIDKFLVERLKEPLLHLVRNAFAHGIEVPATRIAAGKPEEATLRLHAESDGDSVVIRVSDDGAGIDADAVATRAARQNLKLPPVLDARGLLDLICEPGFSTRDEADLASGRGVGMAVVAESVRHHGGTLALETTLGHGTTFTLRLPLSISITDAIIVGVGSERCAVPMGTVAEIIQTPSGSLRTINREEIVPYRDGLLPVRRLRTLFQQPPATDATSTILVITSDRGSAGLIVDRVIAQREIVMRPLTDPLLRIPGLSGATELGDGRPLLILDPAPLTDGAVRPVPVSAST
ncbi:MAG TPA: chemotaxis protein CheA [Candidatus Didemnitutus sp.]|nr:chemotaxis protein CheA [Candidatus Didemnitutus sp.]